MLFEAYNTHALKAGMTVSNEPGYYEDGHYGIRIESIILVKGLKTPNNFANKGYLGFEHVTMQVQSLTLLSPVTMSRTGVPSKRSLWIQVLWLQKVMLFSVITAILMPL